jgi:hypothetical protein
MESVSYARSWRRGQTFGADRFESELADLRPAARRSRAQERLFLFLDGLCSKAMLEAYLRDIADTLFYDPTKRARDAFHFHHHKSRMQAKPRLLRLLDLSFLAKGTNYKSHRIAPYLGHSLVEKLRQAEMGALVPFL